MDDNEINRIVLTKQLQALQVEGLVVATAVNGLDAVQRVEAAAAAATPFDLCVMDIEMPVMDGLEATERIRARERATDAAGIVIVGLSGNARQEHRDRALAAGMDDYVVKPYTKADFIAVLLGHIQRRRGHRSAEQP